MAALITARQKKFYQRGVVVCRKCATPIHVRKLTALPDEISVLCKTCGTRNFYSKLAITVEELPERRKKPRD